MVNIAIVQAGSIIHNTRASLDKLRHLTREAAQKKAQLVVFPEAFIGGYPKGLDFGVRLGSRSEEGRDEFKRYFDSSITYHGIEADEIAACARENYIHLAVGVVERDCSTLYCSVFFFGPNGKRLGRHRKLQPTALERVIWGCGDGSTITVLNTVVGRIGAAICWENYMPLLRTAMYKKEVQIYLAPTVDDRDTWLPTMRMIAIEGRCFVISACQFLTANAYPEDHLMRHSNSNANDKAENEARVLIRGGSCAVDPFGNVLLEPNFDGEHITVIDCNLDKIICAKFDLNVVGHYARPDIFHLHVDESAHDTVTFEQRNASSQNSATQ